MSDIPERLRACDFFITIDQIQMPEIKGISSISIEVDVSETRDSGSSLQALGTKRPGRAKYGSITIKRSDTGDTAFWSAFQEIGQEEKRTFSPVGGTIVVKDRKQSEVASFTLTNVWPSSVKSSDLEAGGDSVIEEEITLVVEKIVRTK